LRVFLPNFWMKLIQPINKQPDNIVQFHCSMEMTKFDIKNYLQKVYNVNVLDVKTYIATGKTKREKLHNSIIKEDDRKIAYVVLVSSRIFFNFSQAILKLNNWFVFFQPEDQSFVFPSLFKETKDDLEEKNMDETKKSLQEFVESNKAPGLPAWFRM